MHGKPKPEDILDLAQRNPVVSRAIMMWRMGYFTWEEAMMFCVIALARAGDGMMEDSEKRERVSP